MLELVDLTKKLAKGEYKELSGRLRDRLGELQRQARDRGIPVLLVFEGWEGAGKGTLMNELILPLDPRGFEVRNLGTPTEEERFYPFLWRYWRWTPARGRLVLFSRSWYRHVFDDRLEGRVTGKKLEEAYGDILNFERQLSTGGALLVKFFLHISAKEQKKRLKTLEDNPATAWRVSPRDWELHARYDERLRVVEEMLHRTDTGHAPWTVVEAHDRDYAVVKVLATVGEALERALKGHDETFRRGDGLRPGGEGEGPPPEEKPFPAGALRPTVLGNVDLSQAISPKVYDGELKELQERFRSAQYALYRKRLPLVVVFEGWDAAGKGGCIKRLTQRLDPRGYQVVPIAAPNDLERSHHYLWRFWTAFPKGGHVAIFDRSWYGRVLVERVEGFASEEEWRRSYGEINEMELHWCRFGARVLKFWLHIDQKEQLQRFEERRDTPDKAWKITEEDWRNREKWPQYEAAVEEMLWRTSTIHAPWTIVEANDKLFARIKVLRTVVEGAESLL
ncbi:MAG TPA: polyphosphate:AMP phosphotransferase [Synergistaceae bacterium]|nr:polyphosphate:AMP phosphotransferase [Synergistaceae bacterium]HQF91018.1 polyphosphate:AMP phosphotransferase [Synergistaceae bacterium]HQH77787.1 polyphosphate:AMP phosphotransferase [Synergistaceae bacterium]HQK24227.1 polyphosphate:AMP phosphotransferase [Synergistaceae bacterium]